jgi:hypothetical protein
MTTTLEKPKRPRTATISPADRLRTTMAAVRLSFTWFGTRKTLTRAQKAEAADTFGAEGEFLSAGKKLIDTRHPQFKAVTAVRSRAITYWRAVSLPYPEPGIRLIRQDRVEAFNTNLQEFHGELQETVRELNNHFEALKTAARERLGRLFNASDYPDSLLDLFDVSWEFPSVEPPEYLRELKPELYRKECERVQSRFDEAVRLAESAFVEELSKLVSHLTERLSGNDGDQPKVFRDTSIGNLQAFFERFRQLNVRSNVQLDELVGQCQQIVRGVQPQALRDSQPLREQLAGQLAEVETVLDGLLVDRPRRRILRTPR